MEVDDFVPTLMRPSSRINSLFALFAGAPEEARAGNDTVPLRVRVLPVRRITSSSVICVHIA